MAASKTGKLKNEWIEAKTEMCQWIKKSISLLPEGTKAGEVKDMVAAMKQMEGMVGMDMPTPDDDDRAKSRTVGDASEAIRRAVKRGTNATAALFDGEEEE